MCMWVSTFTHTSACLTPLCTFYFNVLYSKHGRPQKFPQSRLGQYLVANPAWPRIQCIQHMQVQLLEGVCGAGWGSTWLPTLHGPEISAFSTCRYNSLKEYVGQVGAVLGCQPCTTEIQRIPCKQVQLFSKMTGRLQAQADPAHSVQAGTIVQQVDKEAACSSRSSAFRASRYICSAR